MIFKLSFGGWYPLIVSIQRGHGRIQFGLVAFTFYSSKRFAVVSENVVRAHFERQKEARNA